MYLLSFASSPRRGTVMYLNFLPSLWCVRFLNREDFSGKDLFEEARPLLELEGGLLSVDDTVLDKPYSQEGKTELVGYFWSGKHGRAVKGLCLVTLLYTDCPTITNRSSRRPSADNTPMAP